MIFSADDLDDQISAPPEAVIETVRACPGEISVLGAAGKMGFHLCLMLQRANGALGRNSPIHAVSRFTSAGSLDKFKAAGFQTTTADLSEPDQVDTLPQADNVFFLAGIKFGTASDPGLLAKMNITAPTLVAEHFSNSKIVALSTGCVYAFTTPESGGSKESDRTDPPGEYAVSCLGRERAFAQSNAHTALVRLNYANELRYGVLVDIAQKVRLGTPVDLTTGFVNVIWQGDAIAHIIQSLPHCASPPFVINITGREILKVRDIANAFADKFKTKPQFSGIESPDAWLSNPAQAHQLFGAPKVSTPEMINRIATWLDQGGETHNLPTHFETRSGEY